MRMNVCMCALLAYMLMSTEWLYISNVLMCELLNVRVKVGTETQVCLRTRKRGGGGARASGRACVASKRHQKPRQQRNWWFGYREKT